MGTVFWIIIILGVGGGILAGIIPAIIMSKAEKKNKTSSSNIMTSSGYTVTKELGVLLMDEYHKKWTVAGYQKIFDYSDIIDISETQNGTKTRISGGLGIGVSNDGIGIGVSTPRNVNTTITSWTIDITVRSSSSPLVQILLFSGSTIRVGDFTYNSINLLRNQYVAHLKMMQDEGQRISTVPVVQAIPQPQSQAKVIVTKVVGVTKTNDRGVPIQSILPTISQDSDALLVREKENQYDSNAIKVIADYQHIGYVKADLASQIAPMIDSGKSSRCAILCITGGGDKNYGCNIRIDLV